MQGSTSSFNFFHFYSSHNKIKNIGDTIYHVTFSYFMTILLKATQFIQASKL
jgi:hypothetical protein